MRSDAEIIIFASIETLMIFIRIIAVAYFLRETVRFYRLQGEKNDPYTVITFLFLGLFLFLLSLNRISVLFEKLWLVAI